MKSIIFTGYERSGGVERVSGAYRIATVLRKEGWDVEVVDFFYTWSLEELKELVKSRYENGKLKWIGFSATWINYSSEQVQIRMMDFLQWIKINYPEMKTIAGGQNPSTHFPMYNNIDYIINGFGEVATVEVLKYIYGNGTKIKGIPRKNGWYIDANSFYQAWPISDLSIDYEARDFINHNETLSLEFSRGCKFACAFCNFPILGIKEDTTRDLSNLELELQKNHDLYGIVNYQVADETLNDRDEKLIKIGNVLKKLNFQPNFNAFIRADILFSRPQQLEYLADARVWGHYYGIETLNHETGKIIGKGMHPDKIKAGLLETEEYFMKHVGYYRGTCSLIYGLPKETKESILDALQWFNSNWHRQNIIAFPLNISLTGKKSKLDENYEKYGYTIMGQEKRELFNRHNFFSNDLTIWENQDMNVHDAIDLVNQQLSSYPGYADCWKLWSMMAVSNSLEDALKLKSNEKLGDTISETLQQEMRARAINIKLGYIQKKLSL
jgi:radical SAM superfamily enzyme YgiQ (UPF0313 family)